MTQGLQEDPVGTRLAEVCVLPPLPPGMPLMYWFSRRMTLWGSISFNLAVFINIIIAFFYPYVEATSMGKCPSTCCSSGWKGKGSSHAGELALPHPWAPLDSYNPFCWIKD